MFLQKSTDYSFLSLLLSFKVSLLMLLSVRFIDLLFDFLIGSEATLLSLEPKVLLGFFISTYSTTAFREWLFELAFILSISLLKLSIYSRLLMLSGSFMLSEEGNASGFFWTLSTISWREQSFFIGKWSGLWEG